MSKKKRSQTHPQNVSRRQKCTNERPATLDNVVATREGGKDNHHDIAKQVHGVELGGEAVEKVNEVPAHHDLLQHNNQRHKPRNGARREEERKKRDDDRELEH